MEGEMNLVGYQKLDLELHPCLNCGPLVQQLLVSEPRLRHLSVVGLRNEDLKGIVDALKSTSSLDELTIRADSSPLTKSSIESIKRLQREGRSFTKLQLLGSDSWLSRFLGTRH
jgi:hypothetical protein